MNRLSEEDYKKLEIPLGKRPKLYRFFEILPGTLSFLFILAPAAIGFWRAGLATYMVILYMLIWFFRNVTMSFKAVRTFNKMESLKLTDWRELLEADFYNCDAKLKELNESKIQRGDALSRFRKFRLKRFCELGDRSLSPDQLVHVFMVPMMTESYEIVKETLDSIIKNNYNVAGQVILQICPEERVNHKNKETVARLKKEFKDSFLKLIVTEHPAGLPDELIGKGGNIDWAAEKLSGELKKMGIEDQRVMITTLDADNLIHPEYIAHLSYMYLINFDRDRASYQPIALYINNIWDAPALMRILAVGNSFYTILQASRSHLQRNFSSHSQSLSSLRVTNFWSKKTIVEDGHQYWRSYIAFKGEYRVESMMVPNYQDAVLEENYAKSLKAQFTQLKRWAYGVSDIPYIFTRGLFGKDKIKGVPFWPMLVRFLRHLENDISWAAAPLILAVGAWLPIVFARDSDISLVAHQLPDIARWLQTFATLGALVSVYIAFKILPKRPAKYKKSRYIWMLLQWAWMPVVGIAYGSATGIYSQTRLMLGKYLEKFEFTEKHRK
jgi:hypothetical protein